MTRTPLHLTITSTVSHATHSVARCIRSVRDQSHPSFRHVVFCVDELTYRSALTAAAGDSRIDVRHSPSGARQLDNLLPLWRELPPHAPIVWLDGDDWLAVPHALALVARYHAAGAWVTYGQFVLPDGQIGFCSPVGPRIREERWRSSHLKTFRAGLIQAMRDDDFRHADGLYAGLVPDLRVMFGVIEMCPPGRAVFIDKILYVYNVETSFGARASEADRFREAAEEMRVRQFAPYAPLAIDTIATP